MRLGSPSSSLRRAASRCSTTSREPLRLTLRAAVSGSAVARRGDAVSLFGERARAVRPDFAADGAVAEICRRLDGLPLAIELAAALVKLLPPDALLARLEQRLALLTGGARDLPERQKTLRATIEWSFELLDAEEQELMARLSVFAGGWSLDAAEAVCDAELAGRSPSLVDKSLVREREGRFSMLETIREFALERLAEHDPERRSQPRRHSAYFLAAAEERRAGVLVERHRRRRSSARQSSTGSQPNRTIFGRRSTGSTISPIPNPSFGSPSPAAGSGSTTATGPRRAGVSKPPCPGPAEAQADAELRVRAMLRSVGVLVAPRGLRGVARRSSEEARALSHAA